MFLQSAKKYSVVFYVWRYDYLLTYDTTRTLLSLLVNSLSNAVSPGKSDRFPINILFSMCWSSVQLMGRNCTLSMVWTSANPPERVPPRARYRFGEYDV